jgi:hypothetical protein
MVPMFKRKLIGLMAVVAALSLMAVSASAASAVTLNNESEEALEVGAPLSGFSNNLAFAANSGITLLCSENTVSGEVTENPGATGVVNEATFTGNAANPQCQTSAAGITAEITANPPWELVFEGNHEWTLLNTISFTALIRVNGVPAFTCHYRRTAGVHGTYNTNAAALLTVGAGQTFEAFESPEQCGTAGTLTGEFNLTTTGGEAVTIKE